MDVCTHGGQLQHLIFVNFGLEASVVKVTADQYAQMAHPSRDVPGPNKNKEAAARMRSFSVPNTFKDPNSPKPTADRHLNIMMALQCNNGDVWLFIDHTRLMRFEVHSRGTDWTAKDLFLDSDVSLTLLDTKCTFLNQQSGLVAGLRRKVRTIFLPRNHTTAGGT